MILFISEQQLKELSPISLNLDPKYITEHLKYAHEDANKILGYNLYTKIENDIAAGTVTGVYQTLLEKYIFPVIIYSTLVNALPHIHIRLNNQGVNKANTDYLSTATIEEVEYIRNNFEKRLSTYIEKLQQHLQYNQTTYPELTTATSGDQSTPDLNNNLYSFPLYLGSSWDGKEDPTTNCD